MGYMPGQLSFKIRIRSLMVCSRARKISKLNPTCDVQGRVSESGSGRSTDTDSFNTSHVMPAAVEARIGPKLGRVTPFPLDRTSPKTGTSVADDRKMSTLSAFSEEAE